MGTLGVIGGMGAMATAIFFKKLLRAQTVEIEQDYMDVLIYSKTSIPDRTAYILDSANDSPAPALIEAAQALEKAGASFIAIPCVTAHYFYAEIANAVNIPVINLLDELAESLAQNNVKSVGLLATDGTIQSRILHNTLEPKGIQVLELEPKHQQGLMKLIYSAKRGNPKLRQSIYYAGGKLRHADAIVLGCTELSTLKSTAYVDILDVLVAASLKLGETL